MRKILGVAILLLLWSCGVEYDAETRLVLESRVTNSLGQPLAGVPVEIWVSDNGASDKISNSVTDANGKVLLLFPAPNNTDAPISVRYGYSASTEEKELANILRSDFTDYKLTLDEVLYRPDELTNLGIELVNTSGNTLIELDVEDNPGALIDYWNFLADDDFLEFVTYHRVAKNTTVNLVYKVRTTSGGESGQTIPIVIGETPVTYTLTY